MLELPRAAVPWTTQNGRIVEEEAARKEECGPGLPRIWQTELADPRIETQCFLAPPLDCLAFLEGAAFLWNFSTIQRVRSETLSAVSRW